MLGRKNKNNWPIANVKLHTPQVKLAIFAADYLKANAREMVSELV